VCEFVSVRCSCFWRSRVEAVEMRPCGEGLASNRRMQWNRMAKILLQRAPGEVTMY
jgi:hypothetical protein